MRNDGSAVHEFVVLRTRLAADDLPRKGNKAQEDVAGRVVDELEGIRPGGSSKLTVRLKAGHYVLLCNLPGHYAGGMPKNLSVR